MPRLRFRAGPRAVAAALLVFAQGAIVHTSATQTLAAAPTVEMPMSDAQIAGVVLSAAATDISQAELALRKASHPRVKTLAREMVADNTLLDQNTLHLLARLGVQSAPSAESDRLIAKTIGTTNELAGLRGAQFDRAYLASEVAELRELLARLDGLLTPKAQSREVRGLLVSIRPVFESHLNHAESVAAELAG